MEFVSGLKNWFTRFEVEVCCETATCEAIFSDMAYDEGPKGRLLFHWN
jgi:hypothetical protein